MKKELIIATLVPLMLAGCAGSMRRSGQQADSATAEQTVSNMQEAEASCDPAVETYTDIEALTPAGDMLRLSELIGQTDYVLVDFWATWCPPCREYLPVLSEIYHSVPAGKLEILGVSLDKDYDKWTQYITDNNLDWKHISDLKGWDSRPAAVYGVDAIPTTVLIDRDGHIVGRDMDEESLMAILQGISK